jgi:deoxyribose-phosphate aldolase
MISTYNDLIQFIDLTNLSDDIPETELVELCNKCESRNYKVAALCIEKKYIKFCKQYLSSSDILIASVFNFPNGDQDISEIFDDVSNALSQGVDELDIVIPIKKLKEIDDVNDFKDVILSFASEMRSFVPNNVLKFIISTDVLKQPSLIQAATEAVILAKGDFVKTCTGKNGAGVTLEALQVMLEVIKNYGGTIGIKASGGIKNFEFAGEIYRKTKKTYNNELTSKLFRLGASSLLDDLFLHGQDRLLVE